MAELQYTANTTIYLVLFMPSKQPCYSQHASFTVMFFFLNIRSARNKRLNTVSVSTTGLHAHAMTHACTHTCVHTHTHTHTNTHTHTTSVNCLSHSHMWFESLSPLLPPDRFNFMQTLSTHHLFRRPHFQSSLVHGSTCALSCTSIACTPSAVAHSTDWLSSIPAWTRCRGT